MPTPPRPEITKTAISRKMDESDYNDYMQLRNLSTASIDDILDYVYNDVDFCYRGVMARLEWLSLQAISKGIVSVTNSNNAGPDTVNDVDFQIPDANKLVAQTAVWKDNPSTAKPIQDLIYMHRTAKDNGHEAARILMRQDDFYDFIATDEVKNTLSPYMFSGTQTTNLNLGVDQVNMYLTSIGLPPISIVDQSVQVELSDGSRSALNPWAQQRVSMIPARQLGNMLSAPQAEEGAIKEITESKRRNILIQKYSEVNPFAEWTKATTNSFVKFPRAMEVYIMDISTT